MKTVGIIGYGSFGSFMVRKLLGKVGLKVCDSSSAVPPELRADLVSVACCDYVVLAIPVEAYESVLESIKDHLTEQSVIVDISSVKTVPASLIKRHLPGVKTVLTHPLFGPQSAESSLSGHVVVMCPNGSDAHAYKEVKSFAESLGLNVVEKSPEDHDREMAYAQGLTFFVARALMNTGIHHVELETPSFKKLLDLAELERNHSEDLFRTIQLSNPYAVEVRRRFIEAIHSLKNDLDEGK